MSLVFGFGQGAHLRKRKTHGKTSFHGYTREKSNNGTPSRLVVWVDGSPFQVPAVSFVFFFPPSQAHWDALVWPICDVKGWALSKVIPQKVGFGPGYRDTPKKPFMDGGAGSLKSLVVVWYKG